MKTLFNFGIPIKSASFWICLGHLALAATSGIAAEADLVTRRPLGQPFWKSKKMMNEPILFVQAEGKPVASGKLLFTPTAKLKLTHPDQVMTYVEGKDYVWNPGSDTIELTISSRIPFKTAAQMTPPPGSPNTLGGGLWSEGHFFHDLQVQASYEHDGVWNVPAAAAENRLSRILDKLRSKQALKLVALGDSITEGFNASGFSKSKAPPYQPPYAQLVADTLQERFGAPITFVNFGRAGTKAEWGLTQVEKVAAEKPDLIILAFGMNHSDPAPAFDAVMRKLLAAVTAACPQADIVLVSSMTSNPKGRPATHFTGYRDVLREMQTPVVALADVTTPWLELLKNKPFSDLSGNNVNHPNDFGHAVYGHVICELFPATKAIDPAAASK